MSRFRWLYDGTSARDPRWDIDLSPTREFATIPTKGSIVPNWVLVLPRTPVTCVADLSPDHRRRLFAQSQEMGECLRLASPDNQVFIFEHGARDIGSPTGCGVDHAHLHVVTLAFDLMRALDKDALVWRDMNFDDPWDDAGAKEYLFATDGSIARMAWPDRACSQYFRKLIANWLGRPDEWDYTAYAFPANVAETVNHFGSAA